MKIFLTAGARPNFMKIAPIVRALQKIDAPDIHWQIINTGQHYDYEMSKALIKDLDIPEPQITLNTCHGTQSEQIVSIMLAFEEVCLSEKPDLIIVVGDVNASLACATIAKKLSIKLAHVEAGLRSFDQQMPEEKNRIVIDTLSDYLYATEESAVHNLLIESNSRDSIHFVGNVMIDNLHHQLKKLSRIDTESLSVNKIKKETENYAFLTLHRPSNVDDKVKFGDIISALEFIAQDRHMLFPVHPRTRKALDDFSFKLSNNITQLPPLNYSDALYLWKDASLVLTDSGGLQEETTALGVPCFTIRENTERPITVDMGSNTLVGTTAEKIIAAYQSFKNSGVKTGKVPKLWDGNAANRIVKHLQDLAK